MDIYSSPVSKFMTKRVITTKVNTTIKAVCKSMYDNNVGFLVIVKRVMGGIVPVGIITERDVVKIRQFMSYPLITGSPTTTLTKAMEIMSKKNIRRLPIIEKGGARDKLVGIITEKDIINAIVRPRRN